MMTDRYSMLASDPDLQRALCAACDIPTIEHSRTIDSTQRRARELAASDAPAWTVVATDYQSAGRGQHGRRWASSPASGVLFSILVTPRSPEALSLIPIRVGSIISGELGELVDDHAISRIKLKWPNDIFADDAKLGGILCEAQTRGTEMQAVIGIGINVRPFEPTPGVTANATSLDDVTSHRIERFDVLRALVGCLRRTLDLESPVLAPSELARHRAHDWLEGREITAPVAGTVTGINPHGHLLVRLSNGNVEAVVAGTVRW